jgi:hypothetical protein
VTISTLSFAEPFFTVQYLENEQSYPICGKTIVLNIADLPILIEGQSLGSLQSLVVRDTAITHANRAVLIERFADYDSDDELFEQIKQNWPLAFDVRNEERLRGVSHYMSPKVHIDNLGLSMYHSGSVPLNVGLHKYHPFCDVPGFREVHTQIIGFGKMQQCREQDINTLYLEEPMAPGATHKPMYNARGEYPWHQYETITPSVFMAVELIPESVSIL